MEAIFKSITQLAKIFIQQKIQPGDCTIDATAGNGYDTLFLAQLVSDHGKVFSFDTQPSAIKNTKEKLLKENLMNRVDLIMSSHENINQYVQVEIKAAMFNLGYLPGGDHRITTTGDSTISALEQTMKLLLPGGIISICAYDGHPEGVKEVEKLYSFLNDIDNKDYNVVNLSYINKANHPPKLILIEKSNV